MNSEINTANQFCGNFLSVSIVYGNGSSTDFLPATLYVYNYIIILYNLYVNIFFQDFFSEFEGNANSCKISLAIVKSFRVIPNARITRLCV